MKDDAKGDGARERSAHGAVPRGGSLPLELLLWLPVGVTPILNGAIRMAVYARWLGEPAASWLSSALDVLVMTAYAVLAQRRRPLDTWPRAAGRGVLWSVLTASSHFGLGAFVFGIPWPSLVAKYDLLAGETWPIVSLAILAAPPFARWRAGPVARHRARATPSSP